LKTDMYRKFRFCVRLNAFTATVGAVNDFVSSRMRDTISVNTWVSSAELPAG